MSVENTSHSLGHTQADWNRALSKYMYICNSDCFRYLGHTFKRTQMSQIWCDPDVPEFAQPLKHGMHLDSKKRSGYYPSVHIVHITTGSCLGIWDNSCEQLIKAFTVGKHWSTDGYSCGSMFRQTIVWMHWLQHVI